MDIINTIGRRKTSVARVYLNSGKGNIVVNNRDIKDYFPSEVLQISDEIEVRVLNLDVQGKKISLGVKQTQENPWARVQDRCHVGDRTKGVVRNLTDYGAFIELEPGIDGLVHISDISWTHKVSHPNELLKKGDEVEVMVLSVDPESQKISLGMKQ